MPRAKKTDKFFIYAPKKSGYRKGKKLLGVNHPADGLTIQDLVEFLKEQGIPLSTVSLPSGFITTAKV